MKPGSDILAYTPTYGSRLNSLVTIPDLRASAGCWFDWVVFAGSPSPALKAGLDKLLEQSTSVGIQYLRFWRFNKGQHFATLDALQLARMMGYKWLLRLDDDVTSKTKRWLKKLVDRTEELRRLAGDDKHRIICGPRLVGLNNPVEPEAQMNVGQNYVVNVMPMLGGACRLHRVDFLKDFIPPLKDPKGRGDPQAIADYTQDKEGVLVQFPDIRLVHRTSQLEEEDTPDLAYLRRMGKYWPFLGTREEQEGDEPVVENPGVPREVPEPEWDPQEGGISGMVGLRPGEVGRLFGVPIVDFLPGMPSRPVIPGQFLEDSYRNWLDRGITAATLSGSIR